jgi:hypothetical protein
VPTVKLIRVEKLKIPKLEGLDKLFWTDVEAVGIKSITDNILQQKQADGSQLKRNQPSTLERKRAAGRGGRSLIDRLHRFIRGGRGSWVGKRTRRGMSIGPATGELKKLSREVQKRGYVGWLGFNKEAVTGVRAALRAAVRRIFRKA